MVTLGSVMSLDCVFVKPTRLVVVWTYYMLLVTNVYMSVFLGYDSFYDLTLTSMMIID